jgi:nitrogen regulatory protein PII-like uncharacterized protein
MNKAVRILDLIEEELSNQENWLMDRIRNESYEKLKSDIEKIIKD